MTILASRSVAAAVATLAIASGPSVVDAADSAARWPLPEAPLRLTIPDVPAFDAVLTGGFRDALRGRPAEDDRLIMAWRQSRVGNKLETQWSRFAHDLPWTWDEILGLKTRGLAVALLEVGHLEAVLVIDTPLAQLPVAPPGGEERVHAGIPYRVVARGAGDGSDDPDRRMGLAWARHGSYLLLASSERALKLALDTATRNEGYAPALPGLVTLDLDIAALRKDRYFRREFLFVSDLAPETTRVRAALRWERGRLVEVREGDGPAGPPAHVFTATDAIAAAWEPDASQLAHVLRAGVLETQPELPERPRPTLVDLPPAAAQSEPDRYMVRLDRPAVESGAPPSDEAELPQWRALFASQPVEGWGYAITADGGRRVVFAWPKARDADLQRLCEATLRRRAGATSVVDTAQGANEYQVGPALPTLVVQRAGGYVWITSPSAAVADLPVPTRSTDLTRWARLDLSAVRGEAARCEAAEGPPYPETTRPFSDRILGILSWIPGVTHLTVERRATAEGWAETVAFEGE